MRAEKKKREKDGKLGNLETLKLGNSDGGKVETGRTTENLETLKLGNSDGGKVETGRKEENRKTETRTF